GTEFMVDADLILIAGVRSGRYIVRAAYVRDSVRGTNNAHALRGASQIPKVGRGISHRCVELQYLGGDGIGPCGQNKIAECGGFYRNDLAARARLPKPFI